MSTSGALPTAGYVSRLETVDEQLSLFTDLSPQASESLLRQTITEIEQYGEQLDASFRLWKAGDAAQLDMLLLAPMRNEYPALFAKLFSERNERMLQRLQQLLTAKPGRYFVVVGAGHLVGAGGIVDLLRARGIVAQHLLSLLGARLRRGTLSALVLAVCAAPAACRTAAEPEPEKRVALPAEDRLQFSLPASYLPLELRGEGSETLRAPPGATVRTLSDAVQVEAGADFALEVELSPQRTQLAALAEGAAAGGARRVMQESDVVVFEAAGGYWFVMSRELVPDWDETERRRVACSSAGAARKGALTEPRRFPRAAVERMVAACRSLALPRLE
jgi:hypothetical protein